MRPPASEVAAFIRRFVAERARLELCAVGDEVDLVADGLLDSIGLLDLISAVEQCFGVAIDFADLELDQFSRVGDLAALVERSAPAAAGASP